MSMEGGENGDDVPRHAQRFHYPNIQWMLLKEGEQPRQVRDEERCHSKQEGEGDR